METPQGVNRQGSVTPDALDHQDQVKRGLERVNHTLNYYDEALENDELDYARAKAEEVLLTTSAGGPIAELGRLGPYLKGTTSERVGTLGKVISAVPVLSECLEDLDAIAFSDNSSEVLEKAIDILKILFTDFYNDVHSMITSMPVDIRAMALHSSFRSILRGLKSCLSVTSTCNERIDTIRWKIEDQDAEMTKLRGRIAVLEQRLNSNINNWQSHVGNAFDNDEVVHSNNVSFHNSPNAKTKFIVMMQVCCFLTCKYHVEFH